MKKLLYYLLGRLVRLVDDLETKPIYLDKEKRYKTTIKMNKQKYSPDKWNAD